MWLSALCLGSSPFALMQSQLKWVFFVSVHSQDYNTVYGEYRGYFSTHSHAHYMWQGLGSFARVHVYGLGNFADSSLRYPILSLVNTLL